MSAGRTIALAAVVAAAAVAGIAVATIAIGSGSSPALPRLGGTAMSAEQLAVTTAKERAVLVYARRHGVARATFVECSAALGCIAGGPGDCGVFTASRYRSTFVVRPRSNGWCGYAPLPARAAQPLTP